MKKMYLVISILLLIAVIEVYGADFLYHSDGPYKGKVIDLETGEPIEGAVVVGVWYLTHRFCDAEETITDKNGEFKLPKGSCFSLWPFTEMESSMTVFKPGYLGYPPDGNTFEERKAKMPDFTGYEFKDKKQYYIIKLGKPKTKEERRHTFHDASSALATGEEIRKLPNLKRLVNEEAKNLGFATRP